MVGHNQFWSVDTNKEGGKVMKRSHYVAMSIAGIGPDSDLLDRGIERDRNGQFVRSVPLIEKLMQRGGCMPAKKVKPSKGKKGGAA